MAHDRFGRSIHYLRISLTDHCNLRCVYCMPEEAVFRPRRELMQDDEVVALAGIFAELGVDKIRLTGGEPTVRAGVVELVGELAAIPGIRMLSMTTNGVLLDRLSEPLARAGLHRVNISLDTLDPDRFRRITRRGSLEDVWRGIRAAEQAGLGPIKLNAVVVRGHNELDVPDLAALTLDNDWQVRFIEMMPFAGATDVQTGQLVTHAEIRERIEASLGPLEVADDGRLDGEARTYRLAGAAGVIGLISSVTQPFCASCTRIRLTADGRLRLCLLREGEIDVLTPLRGGAGREEIQEAIQRAIWRKPWGHGLDQDAIPVNRAMNEIGG